MPASKRPSTSSLRRFISSRPYVTVAELRRRFGLDDPDGMACVTHDGRAVYIGLPDREALKIDELLMRGELGLQLSVEVRAPVAVGVYPMRIARYVADGPHPGISPNALPHEPLERSMPDASLVDAPPSPVTGFDDDGLEPALIAPEVPLALAARPNDAPLDLTTTSAADGVAVSLNGSAAAAARSRETRAKGHNGRPVPHRHRRGRPHRPHPGASGTPGAPPGLP